MWEHAASDGCEPDCRMATTMIEVCARAGDTPRALATYDAMREAPRDSRAAPSVHAYTAAMRAAAEGCQWQRALDIWRDMVGAGCRPTGHAYAAVISACATGGDWQRAVQLFDEMLGVEHQARTSSAAPPSSPLSAPTDSGSALSRCAPVACVLKVNVQPSSRDFAVESNLLSLTCRLDW